MQTVAAIEVAAPTITMTTSMPSGDAQRTMFEDRRVLNLAFYVMVVVAVVWLGYQFWRLLFQPSPLGAVDLRLRHGECQEWFDGVRIYQTRVDAVYPPASYLMLWPLLGWSSSAVVRVFWVLPTLLSIAWITRLVVQHSGVTDAARRRLLWVLPAASYPVGATVGNGQLSILVVACLLAGLGMLAVRPRSWGRDLAVACLMLAALVKPSVAAYFFWIPLFVPGGFRVACLVVSGYVALTIAATFAQEDGVVHLMQEWLTRATRGAKWGASLGGGAIGGGGGGGGVVIKSINLHSLLTVTGQKQLIASVSYVPLLLLGAWVYLRRRGHLLSLLGVTAIVARFCSYHGWYDDVMMLIPLTALFFWAREAATSRSRSFAACLAVAFALSLLAPGGTYSLPRVLANVYAVGQSLCWLVAMVFLASAARKPYHEARAGAGS